MWEKTFLNFVYYFNVAIVAYFLAMHGSYILLNIISLFRIKRYIKELRPVELKGIFRTSFHKPISVLIPARNEEQTAVKTVKSMLQLEYPEFEVIVINDGSTDGTLRALDEEYDLAPIDYSPHYEVACQKIRQVFISRAYPNLIVIDKESGGAKADALNAGINVSKYPLFCAVDADSILERDCLLRVVRPFAEDSRTIATGGIVRIINGCEISYGELARIGLPPSGLGRIQIVEYLRAFLFGRVGLDAFNALLIISGAFGLFKKSAVIEIGGYRNDAIGEDMDLIVRLHRVMREKRRKYRITFVPDPVCWTEAPETFKALSRQRNRWQRGLADSLIKNIRMLFNPRYGMIGLVAMPYFFLFELLSPLIEIGGYLILAASWYFGVVDNTFAVLLLSAAIVMGITLSTCSLCLEELSFRRYPRMSDILTLFFYGILENFGYRQLHSLWRFKGMIDYALGRTVW